MKKFAGALILAPQKRCFKKLTPLWVPMTPHFFLENHFPFKNIDVFQKAELIIFIFGHATVILSSEIKIFQLKKNLDDRTKIAKSRLFFKDFIIFSSFRSSIIDPYTI